jgi:nitrous oxidase accessory protein
MTRWTATCLLTASLTACGAGDIPRRVTNRHAAGPVERTIPPGAKTVASSAGLQRALLDPTGPTELWLKRGVYVGDFTVNRQVALHGERGAVLEGTGHGTVLDITADGVVVDNIEVRHSGRRHTTEDAGIKAKGSAIALSNLRVHDTLFGISLGPCPRCTIERSEIIGLGEAEPLKGDAIKVWESDDAVVRDCVVSDSRDVVVWYSRRVLLDNNVVTRSRYGTHFMYAHDSIVRHSQVEGNVVGIFVMYSSRLQVLDNVLAGARGAAGVGLGFKESDAVQVRGNYLVANTVGTYLDETPRAQNAPVALEDNVIALNDVGVRFHGVGPNLSFTRNVFRQNTLLADVEGGSDATSIAFRNNHFSDYVGYDLDHDGFGDVAYQVKRLSGALLEANPGLRFFQGTVAMGLIDVIANAVPVFASRLLLQDGAPAMGAGGAP